MDTEKQDAHLVRNTLAGDRDAFAALYESYFPRIYRYLYHRTLHRETAEDLTSRCFLKALDKLDGYSEKRGSFSAWLYRIAGNCLIDHFRKDKRVSTTPSIWEEYPSDEDFIPDVHNRICWEQLKPIIAALPADKRELLFLRVWDNLSFPEIAEITGKSEGACKMGFTRIIDQLKNTSLTALILLITYGKLL